MLFEPLNQQISAELFVLSKYFNSVNKKFFRFLSSSKQVGVSQLLECQLVTCDSSCEKGIFVSHIDLICQTSVVLLLNCIAICYLMH